MLAQVELNNELTEQIVRAVVQEMLPSILKGIKEQAVIEKPVSKKEIAKNTLGCDVSLVKGFIDEGMPYVLRGNDQRFYPSQVHEWDLKRQKNI